VIGLVTTDKKAEAEAASVGLTLDHLALLCTKRVLNYELDASKPVLKWWWGG
jgi:hypothetical protein